MLNIQNLIILMVLLTATLVNSMGREFSEITEADIQAFANRVEDYRSMTDCTGDRVDEWINHFKSWSHWNSTSDSFRKNCVLGYELGMQNDPVAATTIAGLERLAYGALDTEIEESFGKHMEFRRAIQRLKANDRSLKDNKQVMLIAILEEYLTKYP